MLARALPGVPVLVDVDRRYYDLDPDLIERAITPRTRAIIPVHLFGQPADMARIAEPGVFIVDDVAFIKAEEGEAIAQQLERRKIRKQYYLETRCDVLIRNEEESQRLAVYQKYVPEIQDALPVDAVARPSKRGHLTPMEVMDAPYRAGDLRQGYQAVADNLPNDPLIHQEKGTKKIFFKNFSWFLIVEVS